jgi:N-acetylmuramate 1-kinase
MKDRALMIDDFLAQQGLTTAERLPLQGDASFRRYVRIRKQNRTYMLMDAPPEKEDVRPYMAIAEHFYRRGYSTPKIVASDAASGLLLLEDLGDTIFSRVIAADPAMEKPLYEAAVDVLVQWHKKPKVHDGLSLPQYDHALLMREVELFADWYLPRALGEARAAALKPGYMALWEKLLGDTPLSTADFVHRDYHADNLLWLPERKGIVRVGLLDFQDAVNGDPAYDLVSLLEDARRDVTTELSEALVKRYITISGADHEHFMRSYALLAAQRNSKIIGIFVRLCVRDGKPHYLKMLPRVWGHLEQDVRHPLLKPLADWLKEHQVKVPL